MENKIRLASLIILFSLLVGWSACGGEEVSCNTYPRIYLPSSAPEIVEINKYEFINQQFEQTMSTTTEEFANLSGITEQSVLERVSEEILEIQFESPTEGSITNQANGSHNISVTSLGNSIININSAFNLTERLQLLDQCAEISRCKFISYYISSNGVVNLDFSHCNSRNLDAIINEFEQFQNPMGDEIIYILRVEQTLKVQ